jgi:exodeoxyribonuclease-3
MTTVLTLNIQHGGGHRVNGIGSFVTGLRPDMVVLTEFRANKAGAQLRGALHDYGFIHQVAPATKPQANTVLLVSRLPFESQPLPGALNSFPERLLFANFRFGSLLAVYFPLNDAKVPVFQALLASSPSLTLSPVLLIGDFNTGRHYADEKGATFVAADLFGSLEQTGWLDAWRHLQPTAREFSWYSSAGNGFRIDHAFLSAPAVPRLREAFYDHTARESGLSDHSALLVRMADQPDESRPPSAAAAARPAPATPR